MLHPHPVSYRFRAFETTGTAGAVRAVITGWGTPDCVGLAWRWRGGRAVRAHPTSSVGNVANPARPTPSAILRRLGGARCDGRGGGRGEPDHAGAVDPLFRHPRPHLHP